MRPDRSVEFRQGRLHMRLLTLFSLLLLSAAAAADTKVELLDFTAGYCQPCQQMLPVLNRMQNAGFPIRKIDVSDRKNASLIKGYRVEHLPTFIVLLNGRIFRRFEGIQEEHLLRSSMLEAHAAGKAAENPAPEAPAETRGGFSLGILQPWKMGEDKDNSPITRGQSPESSATDPLARAEAATVRVRVAGANQTTGESIVDLGTGTVIASKPGESLLLTCAHLFADLSPADTKVSVECFLPSGPQVYPAEVICGSRYFDLVLLRIATPRVIEAVPLSAEDLAPKPEQTLISIGCNEGDTPSRTKTGLVTMNRYPNSPPHLICSGDPESGRSGGGLYDRRGYLVGICIAALREQNEGLFMGAGAIRLLFEEQKLTHLLPPSTDPPATTIPVQPGGSNSDPDDALAFEDSPAFDSRRMPPMGNTQTMPEQERIRSDASLFSVPPAEQAPLAGIEPSPPARAAARSDRESGRQANDLFSEVAVEQDNLGTEIEVIINPGGPADQKRIIRIPHASRWLLKLLTGEDEAMAAGESGSPAVAPEAIQSGAARYPDEPF